MEHLVKNISVMSYGKSRTRKKVCILSSIGRLESHRVGIFLAEEYFPPTFVHTHWSAQYGSNSEGAKANRGHAITYFHGELGADVEPHKCLQYQVLMAANLLSPPLDFAACARGARTWFVAAQYRDRTIFASKRIGDSPTQPADFLVNTAPAANESAFACRASDGLLEHGELSGDEYEHRVPRADTKRDGDRSSGPPRTSCRLFAAHTRRIRARIRIWIKVPDNSLGLAGQSSTR